MSDDQEWNWTFEGFADQHGNIIQTWYDGESPDVQVEFDLTLKMLRQRSNNQWSELGKSTKLKGEFREFTELKFKVNKVHYRPIGIFSHSQTFTILAIATKHNFDAQCRKALTRKRLVENNPGAYSNESDCLSDIIRKAGK